MAKVKRQDIFFYIAMVLLFMLVGIALWRRLRPPEPAMAKTLQVIQLGIIPAVLLLFLLSLRQPLRRWNKSLFDERQDLNREQRRKKKRRT